MTGPAEGKLGLKAQVYLVSAGEKVKLKNTFVCIHLKGYALARVTHLDLEHDILDNLIPPKRGSLLDIEGFKGGIKIKLEHRKEVEYEGRKLEPQSIRVVSPRLNKVLSPTQGTRTWVGGKFGGIYIGFRKPELEKLEKLAKEMFKMSPRW